MTDLLQRVADPPRRTLEDELTARGYPATGKYPCPVCCTLQEAVCLVVVDDIEDIEGKVACSTCFLDALRVRTAINEADAPPPTSWGSEAGNDLRAVRNATLDKYQWVYRPDSGLTDACVVAFGLFLSEWQRMVVDQPDGPAHWAAPVLPKLEHLSKEEAEKKLLTRLAASSSY